MKKIAKKIILNTKFGTYKIRIIWDTADKVYLVSVPRLPEIATYGSSFQKAKNMAQDAIELTCECNIDEGKFILDDRGILMGRIPKSQFLAITS